MVVSARWAFFPAPSPALRGAMAWKASRRSPRLKGRGAADAADLGQQGASRRNPDRLLFTAAAAVTAVWRFPAGVAEEQGGGPGIGRRRDPHFDGEHAVARCGEPGEQGALQPPGGAARRSARRCRTTGPPPGGRRGPGAPVRGPAPRPSARPPDGGRAGDGPAKAGGRRLRRCPRPGPRPCPRRCPRPGGPRGRQRRWRRPLSRSSRRRAAAAPTDAKPPTRPRAAAMAAAKPSSTRAWSHPGSRGRRSKRATAETARAPRRRATAAATAAPRTGRRGPPRAAADTVGGEKDGPRASPLTQSAFQPVGAVGGSPESQSGSDSRSSIASTPRRSRTTGERLALTRTSGTKGRVL